MTSERTLTSLSKSGTSRARLSDIDEFITCDLCFGYLIDATTLIDCSSLHYFCRSCIVKHVNQGPQDGHSLVRCPLCGTYLNNASNPLSSLRADKNLQDIVYKLVPGLYKKEMQRRRDFYSQVSSDNLNDSSDTCKVKSTLSSSSSSSSSTRLLPEDMGETGDRALFYVPEDKISLSLEYLTSTCADDSLSNDSGTESSSSSSSPPSHRFHQQQQQQRDLKARESDRRYLRCAAGMPVSLLKKFVVQKYALTHQYQVELIYNNVILTDDLTIMDVIYIYSWCTSDPMRFYYRIHQTTRQPLSLTQQTSCSTDDTNLLSRNVNESKRKLSCLPLNSSDKVQMKGKKKKRLNDKFDSKISNIITKNASSQHVTDSVKKCSSVQSTCNTSNSSVSSNLNKNTSNSSISVTKRTTYNSSQSVFHADNVPKLHDTSVDDGKVTRKSHTISNCTSKSGSNKNLNYNKASNVTVASKVTNQRQPKQGNNHLLCKDSKQSVSSSTNVSSVSKVSKNSHQDDCIKSNNDVGDTNSSRRPVKVTLTVKVPQSHSSSVTEDESVRKESQQILDDVVNCNLSSSTSQSQQQQQLPPLVLLSPNSSSCSSSFSSSSTCLSPLTSPSCSSTSGQHSGKNKKHHKSSKHHHHHHHHHHSSASSSKYDVNSVSPGRKDKVTGSGEEFKYHTTVTSRGTITIVRNVVTPVTSGNTVCTPSPSSSSSSSSSSSFSSPPSSSPPSCTTAASSSSSVSLKVPRVKSTDVKVKIPTVNVSNSSVNTSDKIKNRQSNLIKDNGNNLKNNASPLSSSSSCKKLPSSSSLTTCSSSSSKPVTNEQVNVSSIVSSCNISDSKSNSNLFTTPCSNLNNNNKSSNSSSNKCLSASSSVATPSTTSSATTKALSSSSTCSVSESTTTTTCVHTGESSSLSKSTVTLSSKSNKNKKLLDPVHVSSSSPSSNVSMTTAAAATTTTTVSVTSATSSLCPSKSPLNVPSESIGKVKSTTTTSATTSLCKEVNVPLNLRVSPSSSPPSLAPHLMTNNSKNSNTCTSSSSSGSKSINSNNKSKSNNSNISNSGTSSSSNSIHASTAAAATTAAANSRTVSPTPYYRSILHHTPSSETCGRFNSSPCSSPSLSNRIDSSNTGLLAFRAPPGFTSLDRSSLLSNKMDNTNLFSAFSSMHNLAQPEAVLKAQHIYEFAAASAAAAELLSSAAAVAATHPSPMSSHLPCRPSPIHRINHPFPRRPTSQWHPSHLLSPQNHFSPILSQYPVPELLSNVNSNTFSSSSSTNSSCPVSNERLLHQQQQQQQQLQQQQSLHAKVTRSMTPQPAHLHGSHKSTSSNLKRKSTSPPLTKPPPAKSNLLLKETVTSSNGCTSTTTTTTTTATTTSSSCSSSKNNSCLARVNASSLSSAPVVTSYSSLSPSNLTSVSSTTAVTPLSKTAGNSNTTDFTLTIGNSGKSISREGTSNKSNYNNSNNTNSRICNSMCTTSSTSTTASTTSADVSTTTSVMKDCISPSTGTTLTCTPVSASSPPSSLSVITTVTREYPSSPLSASSPGTIASPPSHQQAAAQSLPKQGPYSISAALTTNTISSGNTISSSSTTTATINSSTVTSIITDTVNNSNNSGSKKKTLDKSLDGVLDRLKRTQSISPPAINDDTSSSVTITTGITVPSTTNDSNLLQSQ